MIEVFGKDVPGHLFDFEVHMSNEIPIVRRGEPSEGFMAMTELVEGVIARQNGEDVPTPTPTAPRGSTVLVGRLRTTGRIAIEVWRAEAPGALWLQISSSSTRLPFVVHMWEKEAQKLVRLLEDS
jgi:hypothetical protein